ncbi:DUF2163 domain-containing protein [Burkholderia sp. JKS000303]|uniref:DUF2163 domain-containing protein n=1 Tax=Burkholderia sp. JKS000303 TaxID=1938747 RepID=UPI000BF36C89|nr:DUF2163 domain-containing protein [Burkholderia sp. JKS000303]PFH29150.1 putative phage protein (TIGR02218 family) [Burkholderia sp. JKS000303]
MRNISTAMLGYLQAHVRTLSTCWAIVRTDGNAFYFTDHDAPILYNGNIYEPAAGFSSSAIESNSDLSVTNLEADALFDGTVLRSDIQAGAWDLATITIFLVNPSDLTAGQATLTSGQLGQFQLFNAKFKVELRSLAQIMQQGFGDFFSPTCRATFGQTGNFQCNLPGGLGPLTFTGTVAGVSSQASWTDPSLTQTGPTSTYTDTVGQRVPSTPPYQIQIVPPDGGSFAGAGTVQVLDSGGNVLTQVTGSPASGQYSCSSTGLLTFNAGNANWEVFINYSYGIGYFAYGAVKWLTGANAGYSMEVKQFSPGLVVLALPMIHPIAVGDTYQIVAGCDKQFGTCKNRWNNVLNFRGEPYMPGNDTVLKIHVDS